MPACPSCGKEVVVLCADDGLCKNCSPCCGGPAKPATLEDVRQ